MLVYAVLSDVFQVHMGDLRRQASMTLPGSSPDAEQVADIAVHANQRFAAKEVLFEREYSAESWMNSRLRLDAEGSRPISEPSGSTARARPRIARRLPRRDGRANQWTAGLEADVLAPRSCANSTNESCARYVVAGSSASSSIHVG